MRYLRKYNESRESDLEELKDFCEGSLAYLLDDKININYEFHRDIVYNSSIAGTPVVHNKKLYLIIIKDIHNKINTSMIKWDEIKDYFIPFLERLSSKYKLYGFEDSIDYVKFQHIKHLNNSRSFNYYDVINDRINIDKFWSILLKVEV